MPKSLVNRVRLMYLPFDLPVGVVIPLAIANGLEVADMSYAMTVFLLFSMARTLVIMFGIGRVFGPIARWIESAPAKPDPREVHAIDEMIRTGPFRMTMWVAGVWTVALLLPILFLMYYDPYRCAIPPRAGFSAVLMVSAIVIGAIPYTFPMMSVWLNDQARSIYVIAREAGITLRRDRTSLRAKLLYLMACIAMGPPIWVAATSESMDTGRATFESRMHTSVAAADLARDLGPINPADTSTLARMAREASKHGLSASILNGDGVLVAGELRLPGALNEWLTRQSSEDTVSNNSPRDAEVAARSKALNGLVVVVSAPIPGWTTGPLVMTLVVFSLVLIVWAPMCSIWLSIDVVRPIQDMTRAVEQITEVGKLDEVGVIAVTRYDETGVLAAKFNALVDTLRDLSAAARGLAKGDLEVRLEGEGDVAVAFRAMIDSLGRIVRQIHETSVLLAAAATEIYAASQEQEAAAASQSTAMVEIRQTMESLFEASAHVSESVRGVLSNAERTLETTDRMVIRIGDLTSHAGRIGEILETIRDISDRSDLLALNGALEASRAGEAGRGFGLVAAEMRRLAERVMQSTHDVRALVGDIRASGSSTMMATEDSKKLAASTTDAARQITLVTQQARSGTEQVLQSVREIAETLSQSVAAMAQTRASAEQLKGQADKLSTLVRAFRIETPHT
jgi:methyl-accepting chemotaxis protein